MNVNAAIPQNNGMRPYTDAIVHAIVELTITCAQQQQMEQHVWHAVTKQQLLSSTV